MDIFLGYFLLVSLVVIVFTMGLAFGYMKGWEKHSNSMHNHYIHKATIDDYCAWMSRDFPVFVDSRNYLLFKDEDGNPTDHVDVLSNHREKMKDKYIAKMTK